MDWGCDHDTPLHMRLLCEVAAGGLRHCATCGANAWVRPGNYGWGEPRLEWKEAWRRKNHHERPPDLDRVGTDWSKPRMIPWLPWNHPNFWVTSHKEAMRVMRDWGIDPDRGGFISETHRARAQAAATRHTREAVAALSPVNRHRRKVARAKNLR